MDAYNVALWKRDKLRSTHTIQAESAAAALNDSLSLPDWPDASEWPQEDTGDEHCESRAATDPDDPEQWIEASRMLD